MPCWPLKMRIQRVVESVSSASSLGWAEALGTATDSQSTTTQAPYQPASQANDHLTVLALEQASRMHLIQHRSPERRVCFGMGPGTGSPEKLLFETPADNHMFNTDILVRTFPPPMPRSLFSAPVRLLSGLSRCAPAPPFGAGVWRSRSGRATQTRIPPRRPSTGSGEVSPPPIGSTCRHRRCAWSSVTPTTQSCREPTSDARACRTPTSSCASRCRCRQCLRQNRMRARKPL